MAGVAFFFTGALHLQFAPGILNKSPKLRDRKGHVRKPRQFAHAA
jgi:hypothetical protein